LYFRAPSARLRLAAGNRILTTSRQGDFMVVRTRVRAILLPIAFYLVSGGVSGFFVWQASLGDRGLNAKAEYQAQMATLTSQLSDLREERTGWERKVSLMRANALDRDLLDEEARAKLDRVDKNDLLVFTNPAKLR
jgi:cell division protein FtsB